MTLNSRDDGNEDSSRSSSTGTSTVRWKGRNHLNFVAGRSRLRTLPVVIHLLPDDVDWFAKDLSLFDELKSLLRERVIAATNNGDRDAEAPKTRKRARKEELCVQGERLQFTYRYRKTLPRYTVLSYAKDNLSNNVSANKGGRSIERRGYAADINKAGGSGSGGGRGPGFHHLPLSDSTLLVWVYRFDAEDPYRPVPNEAALQFAPAKGPLPSVTNDSRQAFTGRAPVSGMTTVQDSGDARDTGLLGWLWGWENKGGSGGGEGYKGGGGVRQHFMGSAAWQGRSAETSRARDRQEDDLQRAIRMSLEESASREGGAAPAGSEGPDGEHEHDVVIVDGGVEETKGKSRTAR